MKQAITILALLALPHVCLAASPFGMSLYGAKIGGLPDGWTVSKTGEGPGSQWAFVEDATAPGGKALMQTSNEGPRPLFNLCIAEETSFQDLDLTVSFKAVAGEIDQGGGPVWRYQDANNYYVARMNPLENNYRVYKVVAGKRTQLASADVKVPAGEWHEIRIVHKNAQIQCYLDGKLHLEVEDDTFGAAGNVGLWTKADAQTRFVGFRVNGVGNPQPIADVLPTPPEGKAWKLVWADEFDGTRLDDSKWVARPEGKRKGGWWSPKAISLDGQGHLVISTYKDGDKFVDGCIVTQGKYEHAFGYYVARVKFQKEPGHWSAFWITGPGVGKVGDGGRNGTEIDIMEKPWLDERVQHTFHWDGYGKDHKSEGKVVKVPGVMEGFHTFAIWWSPEEYVFYVNGKETWRSKAGGVCQLPQYMLLSDEIGDWAGDITKANLPDKFLVDYVRVYDLVEE
jgi:hypothetical protein